MYSGDNKNLAKIMFEKLWNESETLKTLNAAKEFDYSLTLVWQQQQEGFLTSKQVPLAIQPKPKKQFYVDTLIILIKTRCHD